MKPQELKKCTIWWLPIRQKGEWGHIWTIFTKFWHLIILKDIIILPYCDQSDSDADATLHGGPTQRQIYLDGPPEHQTSHQIQQHSLQQHASV